MVTDIRHKHTDTGSTLRGSFIPERVTAAVDEWSSKSGNKVRESIASATGSKRYFTSSAELHIRGKKKESLDQVCRNTK